MLSGSSLSCRSPPCSHTAISSTSLTVLLQASDLVRYTLSPADLNPSPPRFDLRAVRCHLLVLPFLQNFHQLTVAHSACMCHNLFAVICFSHNYFTTNEKPRRPFWATLASCFSGLFCYSPGLPMLPEPGWQTVQAYLPGHCFRRRQEREPSSMQGSVRGSFSFLLKPFF